ncbi:phospholamban, partial [Mus musculus]
TWEQKTAQLSSHKTSYSFMLCTVTITEAKVS